MSGLVAIPDLSDDDARLLGQLLDQWAQKRQRNILRSTYYDSKNLLRDLGISIPPQLKTVETVLGWPAKAVNSLAARCNFDGFVIPGDEQDPYDLGGMFADNNMDVELPQTITSAMTHATAFLTITPGDTSAGEPEVLLLARSARYATGLWDRRTRSLRAGLSIMDADESGVPTEFVLYQRDKVSTFRRGSGKWSVEIQANRTGRVWMEPIVYRPNLDRPFGHSRISRPVMSITDSAVRTVLRSEVAAEFFNTPQRYALGAEEGAFAGDAAKWKAIMGRLLTLTRDEDGELPQVGQFPQQSQQPHMDQLRGWGMLFCGEAGMPVTELGIVPDANPTSADALYAAERNLQIEATSAARVFGATLRRAATTAVMLRDGLTEQPEELRSLQAKWRDPATPSISAASDAMLKQVQTFPWMAESDVALEVLGYDQPTIERLREDRRRSQGRATIATIQQGLQRAPQTPEVTPDAEQV